MLILIVASGPDKGRIYELFDDRPCVIGRGGDPVRLNDRKSSREHAKLWCEGGQWYLKDLESRHGTYHNHERIDGRVSLNDGDRIQAGNSVFVLARMPVEQAERLALLGDPPTGFSEIEVQPGRAGRGSRVLVGAALAAAAVVIGLNLYTIQQTTRRDAAVDRQLSDLRTAAASSDEQRLERLATAVPAESTGPDATATDAKLEQVLAAVRQGEQSQQLLDKIHQAITEQPRRAESLLDAILAQAQQEREQSRQLERLRQQLEASQKQTAPALSRLTSAVETVQANQQALDHLRGEMQALAQNARQAGPQQAPPEPQIAPELARTLDEMLAELRRRPTSEQIVAPLSEAITRSEGDTREKLQALLARVDDRTDNQDALRESIEQLSQALAQDAGHSQALVEQVLAQLEQQPSRDELASQLRQLQEQDAQQAEGLHQALLAKLEPTSELSQKLAQEFAELRELVQQQPAETEARLAAALRQLETGAGQPAEPEAGVAANSALTATDFAPGAVPGTTLEGGLERGTADEPTLMQAAPLEADELTKTEMAYKLAFETGQPVAIGGGLINPRTGEISEGRVLDPAAARARGVLNWRQWYLMDDYAERMRLRQQAIQYAANAPEPVIGLPETDWFTAIANSDAALEPVAMETDAGRAHAEPSLPLAVPED